MIGRSRSSIVLRARTWQNARVEPQVQYVQTKDGTSIAYAVYGGGHVQPG
jgi:hypothetical protein